MRRSVPVLGAFVVGAVAYGPLYCFPLFAPEFEATFHTSRELGQMPWTVFLLVSALASPLLGRAYDLFADRILLTIGLVLLIAFSNKAVSRRLITPLEAAYPPIPELTPSSPVPAELAACRYIVVLGGGHGDMPGLPATNKLSTSGLGRLIEGVRLARALPDAMVIFSGPSDGRGEAHARVLARAAESLGLAVHRIRLIETAHDTEDEAQAVKAIAGDGKVALVTGAASGLGRAGTQRWGS